MFYNISSSLSKLTRTFFNSSAVTTGIETTIQYIQSLKVIRIVLDDAPGFGNQAASTNLYSRLRELGFKGVIELVYPARIRDKLETLLNITIENSDFLNNHLNIRFITQHEFLIQRRNNQIPVVELGMSGALDNSYELFFKLSYPSDLTLNRAAEHLLNTRAFIRYSSFHGDYYPRALELIDTQISLKNHKTPIRQVDSRFHALITPQIKPDLARKKLISERPAFDALLSRIDKETINVLPVYGWSSSDLHYNLLNILLGARYAQVNKLKKPLIVVLLYELQADVFTALYSLIFSEQISKHHALGLKATWGYSADYPGAVNVRASIRNLTLPSHIRYIPLSQLNQTTIDNLNENDLVLTTTGRLTQDAFHYIFSYLSASMLAPVFEGASSFKHLSTTSARPHLYCAGHNAYWPLNFSSINGTALHQHMMNLTEHTCVPGYESWLKNWEKMNVAELIGTWFSTAYDGESDASIFFRNHYQELLQSDRIMSGLMVATQLANKTEEESLQMLAPHLYKSEETELGPVFTPVGNHTEPTPEPPKKAIWDSAVEALGHGMISGISHTIKYGLQRKGFSNHAAEIAKQATYYISMFGMNFCSAFNNKAPAENVLEQVTESAVEAGLNTGKVLAMQAGTFVVSKALDLCGTKGRIGQAAQLVKGVLRYGIFAASSLQDPKAAACSLAIGGLSEAATSAVGKKIVDLSISKSRIL